MKKIILILSLFMLLTSACSSATPALVEPPVATAPPEVSSTPLPKITPNPIPPAPTATPLSPQLAADLAVITAANVSDLEKITVLAGTNNRVTDLAFSADGAYLASTGYDEKIHLWNVTNWQEVYLFPCPEADLNVIAFSPDAKLLASGQAVWDVASREVVHPFEPRLVEPAHVAFSPDGSQLAVVAAQKIKVWDVASWSQMLSFDVPADSLWLFGISFSPDGKWLAAGAAQNGTVYFWSAETGQLVSTLEQGNKNDVHDIAFSPDGTLLATGGTDYFARIWSLAEKKELQKISLIGMYSLALSPDGTLLATAGPDRAVKLWDVQNGKMLRSLLHADELMAVAFSADGRLIAAGGYDNTIVIWGIPQ